MTGERTSGFDPDDTGAPLRIMRRDPSRLGFEWKDGTRTEATAAVIRRGCPCALCVDERTGAPILAPTTVPDDLEHREVQFVGNYALSIVFSDGHRTGIFTWEALRQLTEAHDHQESPNPQERA